MSDAPLAKLKRGELVSDRWKVGSKLGEGAFGAVYEATDTTGRYKEAMALKLESRTTEDQILKIEVAVLESMSNSIHVCRLISCGRAPTYNFILMTLLGPNIDALRHKNSKNRFSRSTATRVTFQSVRAIRSMHDAGWLHRDIKPSNFALGGENHTKRTIFVFDFGLARRYKNKEILRVARRKAGFRGTLRYCSINGHRKLELGRHDDLISILYMFVEMVNGHLPWSDMYEEDDTFECKLRVSPATLMEKLPVSMQSLHDYLYGLTYADIPNYENFEKRLRGEIERHSYSKEPFDWEMTRRWYHFGRTTPKNSRKNPKKRTNKTR